MFKSVFVTGLSSVCIGTTALVLLATHSFWGKPYGDEVLNLIILGSTFHPLVEVNGLLALIWASLMYLNVSSSVVLFLLMNCVCYCLVTLLLGLSMAFLRLRRLRKLEKTLEF